MARERIPNLPLPKEKKPVGRPEKDKGGRPTKMTEETIAKLKQGFRNGFSDYEACIYAEIDEATLYRWLKKNPEFRKYFDALKESPVLKAKNTIAAALGDPKIAQWYLERKRRTEFEPTKKVDLNVTEGSRFKEMTTEEKIKALSEEDEG